MAEVDPEIQKILAWGGGGVGGPDIVGLVLFFSRQHISHPYKGFNFLSSRSVPVFLREPIDIN